MCGRKSLCICRAVKLYGLAVRSYTVYTAYTTTIIMFPAYTAYTTTVGASFHYNTYALTFEMPFALCSNLMSYERYRL